MEASVLSTSRRLDYPIPRQCRKTCSKSDSRVLPGHLLGPSPRSQFCENPGLFPVERQSQERKDDQEPLSCVRCGACEHDSLSKLQASELGGPPEARSREFGNIKAHPGPPSREEADGSHSLQRWRGSECQHARERQRRTPEPPESSGGIAAEERPAERRGPGHAGSGFCRAWVRITVPTYTLGDLCHVTSSLGASVSSLYNGDENVSAP